MVTYGSNGLSMRAIAALGRASSAQQLATERLSSGLRINRASDDAAGISVSSLLRADARVYTVGIRNLNDGLSAIGVAESGLSALSTVTLRLRELAQQSANGSFNFEQRRALQGEAAVLTEEFNRVLATTRFNGLGLFDLSQRLIRLQGGYGVDGGLGVDFTSALARTTGTGSFSSRQAIAVTNNPTQSRNADLDGDGDLDILFGVNTAGSLGVLLNNGDGTFQSQVTYGAGLGGVAGFTIGDFNGDGRIDAVTGGTVGGQVTLYLGNGDGTFQSGVATGLTGFGQNRLDTADIDGDGILDLVGSSTTGILISYGTGGGGFGAAQLYAITGSFGQRQIQIVDFDRDGFMDILGVNQESQVNYLRGGAGRTFAVSSNRCKWQRAGIADSGLQWRRVLRFCRRIQ